MKISHSLLTALGRSRKTRKIVQWRKFPSQCWKSWFAVFKINLERFLYLWYATCANFHAWQMACIYSWQSHMNTVQITSTRPGVSVSFSPALWNENKTYQQQMHLFTFKCRMTNSIYLCFLLWNNMIIWVFQNKPRTNTYIAYKAIV